jgi:carbamoyl-phosphate synthase large subunit
MTPGRVFISGGGGVIGRELVELLHGAGHTLFVGDLKARPAGWSPAIRYRQGDLNHLTLAELESFAPTAFIHLAATFERSTETYGFWTESFAHNVALSHHLMTLAKDLPSLRRVIFASSYLIYDPRLYTFDETQTRARRLRVGDPIDPRNLTGMAKLAHEIELRFLDGFRRDQFTSVAARIFRGYGRGSRCVISRWIRQLLAGEAIQVYRPEGMFDFIYAGETARGLERLLERPEITGVMNLGSDRARRVSEVVEVLRRHFPGMAIEERESDIRYEASQADMDAFRAATGWVPERNLEECIPLVIEHERAAIRDAAVVPAARHVLIGSVAGKVPLIAAVRQAAAKLRPGILVEGGDAAASPIGAHFVDRFWRMPPLNELTVAALIAHCREAGIGVIVPTRDGELAWYAAAASELAAAGVHVMVSGGEAVEACVDKLRFADLPGTIPTHRELPVAATGRWVVKERFGAGSRSLGLNLGPEEARAHAARLSEPVFQPYVAGREVSVDAYVDRRRRVKGVVVRTRDTVVNGESQVTTTLEAPQCEAACRRVIALLPFYGHLVFQAIVDDAGGVHLIECNARFGGASTLSVAAGLDTFYWLLLEAEGADLAEYPFTYDARTPLRQVRHAADLVVPA